MPRNLAEMTDPSSGDRNDANASQTLLKTGAAAQPAG
jgi:hypothetical protein